MPISVFSFTPRMEVLVLLAWMCYTERIALHGKGLVNVKILGSDYDGTLNRNGIDKEKKQALREWRNAGNVFALISGRGRQSVLDLYHKEQFPCDYLIACNGAVIMETDGSVLFEAPCDGRLAVPLLTFLFEKGAPWGLIQAKEIRYVYADTTTDRHAEGVTLAELPPVDRFDQISTRFDDFDTAAAVVACIRERFGAHLNPLQNGMYIDIVRADMNKAEGLSFLVEHLGASRENVIAVGDNINDGDMLRAFRSYAMESGVEAAKALADHTTPSVTELIRRELAIQG